MDREKYNNLQVLFNVLIIILFVVMIFVIAFKNKPVVESSADGGAYDLCVAWGSINRDNLWWMCNQNISESGCSWMINGTTLMLRTFKQEGTNITGTYKEYNCTRYAKTKTDMNQLINDATKI